MESMEQYYIATEDGRTEGPYLFESLETFYTDLKMRILFALKSDA